LNGGPADGRQGLYIDIEYPISMWHRGRGFWGRRGWLRPWVLGILRTSPKNGAEIIDQIEQVTLGWRPSPGSVYPLLEELASEGLVRKRDDGRYEVTERGQESIAGPWDLFSRPPATVEGILDEMRSNVAYLEDLKAGSPAKLAPQLKALRELGERLTRLGAP
jgi:DNA-binding PadR family transcriptional regulator